MATTTTLPPVAERITGATTLGRMILSASERGDDVALRHPVGEGFQEVTYRQLGERAREIARGLIALGIESGEVVAILCSTRAEWTLCEAGALCAGAVIAPIYHTNSPEECRHVLSHSESRLVFCEDAAQVEKVKRIDVDCPRLQHVIVIDGEAPGASPLRSCGAAARPSTVRRSSGACAPSRPRTWRRSSTPPARPGCPRAAR